MNRAEQQHNLKVAELAYTAFNAGDLATLLKLCQDDVEVLIPEGREADAATYSGHEGFRQWFEGRAEEKVQVLDVVPIGSHLVVVARGGGEMDGGNLLAFRDGNIAALHFYATRDEAVEAARKREA